LRNQYKANIRKLNGPLFIGHIGAIDVYRGANIHQYTEPDFGDGVTSNEIQTTAGVPQGSPMSPILYMFYNADLLDIPLLSLNQGVQSWGFVDDIAYGIQGATDIGNAITLQNILENTEVWRAKHGVRFETTKYVLVHFTKKRHAPTASIKVSNTTITPSNEVNILALYSTESCNSNNIYNTSQRKELSLH